MLRFIVHGRPEGLHYDCMRLPTADCRLGYLFHPARRGRSDDRLGHGRAVNHLVEGNGEGRAAGGGLREGLEARARDVEPGRFPDLRRGP